MKLVFKLFKIKSTKNIFSVYLRNNIFQKWKRELSIKLRGLLEEFFIRVPKNSDYDLVLK